MQETGSYAYFARARRDAAQGAPRPLPRGKPVGRARQHRRGQICNADGLLLVKIRTALPEGLSEDGFDVVYYGDNAQPLGFLIVRIHSSRTYANSSSAVTTAWKALE